MKTIPKSFSLGPSVVSVAIQDTLIVKSAAYGLCIPALQAIFLQKVNPEFNKQAQVQTFYHELTHMILDTMGECELSSNERFVEGFSQLLLQFMQTANGKT